MLSLLLGLLWWLEILQHRTWPVHVFLLSFIGLALMGLRMGLRAGWVLCSLIASLSTWDLHHFCNRLQFTKQDKAAEALIYNHIRRLLIVDGFACVSGGLALGMRFDLSFGLILFLAALAIVCLCRFVRLFRQESD